MSTNLLLVSPYNVNYYGGVQNQVNLFKNGLDSFNFNVRLLAPDSSDYDIGRSIKIPFNGSSNPISLIPCLLYTSPSPRDSYGSRMPSSA